MVDRCVTMSKDFINAAAEKMTNKSPEGKATLFGAAAILGTCWGFSKIYFWSKRRKTKQRMEEEREKLRKDKDRLYQELKNDKDLLAKKDEITNLSFKELHRKIQDGKLTARMVLRAYQLKALEENPDVNAIAYVMPDAEALADKYDSNRKPLILGGIPVTLKDHFTIKGRYASIGLGSYLFRESADDCVIVKVLKKHGAIPYFVTNVPQLLVGVEPKSPIHGAIHNPQDASRTPGISSSGEAALVGAGGSILGWGSDIGGSIRGPAHYCGVNGFKPTSTRLSHVGSPDFFEGQTLVQNSFGPLSRDVDGLVQGMRALWDGYMFDLDPSVVPLTFDEKVFSSRKPLRIGYFTDIDGLCCVSPACKRAVIMTKEYLESQGHQLVKWEFPGFKEIAVLFMRCFLSNDNLDEAKILMCESEAQSSLDYLLTASRYRLLHKFTALLQTILSTLSFGVIPLAKDRGSIAEWWSIATEIEKCKTAAHDSWLNAELDAVISPPSSVPAYDVKFQHIGMATFFFLLVNNLLNMPAGVVPVTHVQQSDLNALTDLNDNDPGVKSIKQAMDEGSIGLPVSVQVTTLTYRDELCLRVIKEIEGMKAK